MTWIGPFAMWLGVVTVVGLFVQSVIYERRYRKKTD